MIKIIERIAILSEHHLTEDDVEKKMKNYLSKTYEEFIQVGEQLDTRKFSAKFIYCIYKSL